MERFISIIIFILICTIPHSSNGEGLCIGRSRQRWNDPNLINECLALKTKKDCTSFSVLAKDMCQWHESMKCDADDIRNIVKNIPFGLRDEFIHKKMCDKTKEEMEKKEKEEKVEKVEMKDYYVTHVKYPKSGDLSIKMENVYEFQKKCIIKPVFDQLGHAKYLNELLEKFFNVVDITGKYVNNDGNQNSRIEKEKVEYMANIIENHLTIKECPDYAIEKLRSIIDGISKILFKDPSAFGLLSRLKMKKEKEEKDEVKELEKQLSKALESKAKQIKEYLHAQGEIKVGPKYLYEYKPSFYYNINQPFINKLQDYFMEFFIDLCAEIDWTSLTKAAAKTKFKEHYDKFKVIDWDKKHQPSIIEFIDKESYVYFTSEEDILGNKIRVKHKKKIRFKDVTAKMGAFLWGRLRTRSIEDPNPDYIAPSNDYDFNTVIERYQKKDDDASEKAIEKIKDWKDSFDKFEKINWNHKSLTPEDQASFDEWKKILLNPKHTDPVKAKRRADSFRTEAQKCSRQLESSPKLYVIIAISSRPY